MTRASAFPIATPPVPEKHPVSDTHHGITRSDDYAWMRADNWQAVFRDPSLLDSRIRAHLEAENAYQATLMADTAALRGKLFAESGESVYEVGHIEFLMFVVFHDFPLIRVGWARR